MRRIVCIFLMLLFPLHSFAMQSGMSSPEAAYDIAHEIDHLVGATHHHDDTHGSVHYDKSGDSMKHFADHSAGHSCAALPPTLQAVGTMEKSASVTDRPKHFLPDPFPDRLQRPPCALG
ncbi:hypothetical protein AYR66_22395 [Noviherbaspirillum denitrificans]|uniref:Cobalt transporter n=2 Tax=Noviherbaspirillum denitrificans TaxID=1968433 RepID=A0A254TGU4_9BURK|nr:hypothetical protein AYR66_22395 [Noviherbaspirillum denitrificans]